MKSWRRAGALLLVCVAGGSHAQTVTMEDYLDMVRKTHPFFEKEAMQVDIEKAARERAVGSKDWLVESAPFAAYTKPVENSTFAPDRVYALGLNASAERTFWGNGARFSVGWESDLTDQDLPGISIPGPGGTTIDVPTAASQFYENRIFASYSLPLMRNRGGQLDRLEYELAGYDIDFSRARAQENQENFLLDVAIRFVDWALIAEQVRIANARLTLAEEQRAQAVRKRRANLVDQVDVLRADDAVQVARGNLVLVQSRFKSKRAELAVLADDDSIYELDPQKNLYAIDTPTDVETAVRMLADQRIVRTLRTRLAQLVRQEAALQNLTRPELSLTVRGALQEGDEDFVDALALSKPDVSVSLGFSYPLGNSAAQADVARSRLQVRQLEKEIESTSRNLEAELRRIWIEMTELEDVLELSAQQVETARKKTREERSLYNQGRSDLTFVIQSQDGEAQAELTYALNAAAYHRLALQYRALADQLLPAQ